MTVYAGVLWLWHHPVAYDAALGGEWLHHLEHLTFFAVAVVFWWPVIGPAPRARRPPSHGLRIAHVLVAALQTSLLALVLSFYPRVIYESYARAVRVSSLLPLEDQAWGGIMMWAGGAAVDMLALLILVWRFLAASERAPLPQRVADRLDDEPEPPARTAETTRGTRRCRPSRGCRPSTESGWRTR